MYKVVATINRHKQQPETKQHACEDPGDACEFMRQTIREHRSSRKQLGSSAGTQSIKIHYCGRTISKRELERRASIAT